MTWPLREIPIPSAFWHKSEHREAPRPGDCWRVPLDYPLCIDWSDVHPDDRPEDADTCTPYGDEWQFFLSPEFKASNRDYVIVVRLPDGTNWVVDHVSSGSLQRGQPQGWTVSGELPQITVTPSINVVGRFHGWVRDGVLTDDVEGRVF